MSKDRNIFRHSFLIGDKRFVLQLDTGRVVKSYLKELRLYTSLVEDGDSIYHDITQLLIDKFSTYENEVLKKLTPKEMDLILKKIGRPEEIVGSIETNITNILNTRPLLKIYLPIRSFLTKDTYLLTLFSRIITMLFVIFTLYLYMKIIAINKEDLRYYASQIMYDSHYARILVIYLISFIAMVSLTVIQFIRSIIPQNGVNLLILLLAMVSSVYLLIFEAETIKTIPIVYTQLIKDATESNYFGLTDVSIDDTISEVNLQIRVDRSSDIPSIYLIHSMDKRGAYFTSPPLFNGEEENILFIDGENLNFNLNMIDIRKRCRVNCFSGNIELYIFTSDEVRVTIKYVLKPIDPLFSTTPQPLEVIAQNYQDLDLLINSRSITPLNFLAISVGNLNVDLIGSSDLHLAGDYASVTAKGYDSSELVVGYDGLNSSYESSITYEGYDNAGASIIVAKELRMDLMDSSYAFYDSSSIENVSISRSSALNKVWDINE